MITTLSLGPRDEPAVRRLAEVMALKVKAGDCILLEGDLGAGKTTLARAFIRALLCDAEAEVPSPTFTLVQTYDTPRYPLAHVDLYRLANSSQLPELGLEEVVRTGVLLVEWPERADGQLPGQQLTVRLLDAEQPDLRDVLLVGGEGWTERLERVGSILDFLTASGVAPDTPIRYLQGDASARAYAFVGDGPDREILMDWPRQPDGPPIRDGKPYSQIALLAEDVRPFVAIADALRHQGIVTPRIRAENLDRGLLLIEDLGEKVFGRLLSEGAEIEPLWRAAVDVLISLYAGGRPEPLPLADGSRYMLQDCTSDVLSIEASLLLDWMWPAVHGTKAASRIREGFEAVWEPLFAAALRTPSTWLLRDYHSPNLIWRPGCQGLDRVGVIDFQDALWGPAAYDLVSLLQDARVDVPAALESDLLTYYISAVAEKNAAFEEEAFVASYRILGAQRATKILGIFVRLCVRDGKPQYLQHLPRIWGLLERNLEHPALAGLREWFDDGFPRERRMSPLAYPDGADWRET